jgi:hypothetical protein
MLKVPDLAERRNTAASAKARLVEKLRARPAADDPAVVARAAERLAVSEARAARQAVREREEEARREAIRVQQQIEAEARAAEEAAVKAAAQAEAMARQQADKDRAGRVMADEAERKAMRDARYAARKARVSGG